MYTKEQVDDVLSQVEQEFEKAIESVTKSENIEEIEAEEVEAQEEDLNKSEEDELDYTSEDYETIDEIYSSMSKSEMEAHYNSIKKSLFSEKTEEEMNKSEKVESEEIEEVSMIKSENEELKTQNEELKKSLDTMNELLDKMFNKTKKAPAQKAITGYSVVAKSEELEEDKGEEISKMSKSEITSKLKGLDYSELNKSERNAINEYCLNNGSVEAIKHLITK